MTTSSTPNILSSPSLGDNASTPHENNTSTFSKKLLIAIPFLSLLLFVIIDSQTSHHVQTAFQSLLAWISAHLVAGIFALITVYILATVAFLPGSILTLGSGFVYGKAFGLGSGVALASGVVFVGACCGAIISFLLGRYLLREWVGESLKDYTRALIGILPGTVLYCFIGASAGSLSESQDGVNGPATVAIIVVGIILGLLAVYIMSSHAKKEFDRIVKSQERQDRGHHGFTSDLTHGNDPEVV
eukprot:CCRYP_011819-RA/>CCRYP_011819-RA protein AED:0.13 eAED:0.13 QI:197/1/1/1/0.5/0.33/3/75/243